MNLNDRIALELGRACFARILAEARAEQLAEQATAEPEEEPEAVRPPA